MENINKLDWEKIIKIEKAKNTWKFLKRETQTGQKKVLIYIYIFNNLKAENMTKKILKLI